MSRAELIYPLKRTMDRQLAIAQSDCCNGEILTRYYKVRSAKVKLATLVFEFTRLNDMTRMLGKKFEDATTQDIEDLIFTINQRHPNANTQNKYRKILKAFMRWLKGYPKFQYPPEVAWIELNRVPLVKVQADDLLSFDECIQISEFAINLRDKALFQGKLDAGCRIGEILTVKVGEVKFNEHGAILHSEGKTGASPLILTWSSKILALWLNIHPFRTNPDAPLWPVLGCSEPRYLSYSAARKAFIACVKKAGYTRRVWLHLLKHVSSTHDAALGLPDSYRKYKHHWTEGSKMPAVYEHLSDSVIPKIQSKTWELMTGSQKATGQVVERPQLIKICKRCEFENPRDSLFCNRCAFPLNEEKLAEMMTPPELNPKKQELNEKINRLSGELAKSPDIVDRLLEALALLRNEEDEKDS